MNTLKLTPSRQNEIRRMRRRMIRAAVIPAIQPTELKIASITLAAQEEARRELHRKKCSEALSIALKQFVDHCRAQSFRNIMKARGRHFAELFWRAWRKIAFFGKKLVSNPAPEQF